MRGERLKGGCLCGRVRLSAALRKHEVGACHCEMCRRWGGGPFLVVETDGAPDYEAGSDANVRTYASSDWASRGFCAQCGSALFYRLNANGMYFVNAATFDAPGPLTMSHEVFIDAKSDYYEFVGERRRMTAQEAIDAFTAAQGGANG